MDFVHDQLATGRKPRVLTIVNTFSRFSPEARADPRRGGLRYAAPHAEAVARRKFAELGRADGGGGNRAGRSQALNGLDWPRA